MIRIIRGKSQPASSGSEQGSGSAGVPPAREQRFVDLRAEIDRQLQEAQQQADLLVAEAERQTRSIRQQACQQGLDDARQQTAQAVSAGVDQRLQTVLPAVRDSVSGIQQERVRLLQAWERQLIQLAVAIAERIVRRELTQQPEITIDLIRETLELAAGSTTLKLRLHPADQQALQEPLQALLARCGESTRLEAVADPAIEQGGCIVDTEYGTIDQQIGTQLERIENELV